MTSLPNSQFPNLIRTDFWFNDGNIILIAQNAAFKVHKGQLARHSEVFSDLFSLPQPLTPPSSPPVQPSRSSSRGGKEDWDMEKARDDLIDGCPFVVLQDSPSDVFYFLSALYDGLYFAPSSVPSRPHPPSFPFLAAVLRLSTKYLVEPLVQRCLFHLSLDWPISLSAWDEREARFTLYPPPSSPSSPKNSRYVPREFCPHPILIIQFALEMNLPEILPAALYDLSRYGPSKIVNGTTLSPTSFDRLVAQLSSASLELEGGPKRPIRLSRELLSQTLRGREEAQRFLASFIEKELCSCPPSPTCQNLVPASPPPPPTPAPAPAVQPTTTTPPTQIKTPNNNPCSDSFYFVLLNILRSVGGISLGRDADALFTLTQASEMLDRTDFYISGSLNNSSTSSPSPLSSSSAASASASSSSTEAGTTNPQRTFGLNMCQACKQDFREKVRKAREEMWSYLPRWFGLVGLESSEVEVEGEAQRV